MFYRCTNMLNEQVFAYSQNKCNYIYIMQEETQLIKNVHVFRTTEF